MTVEAPSLTLVDAEVDGILVDIELAGSTIAAVTRAGTRPPRGADVLDAGGCVVIPTLHDHHLHLAAAAVASSAVVVGPPLVSTAVAAATAIADTARGADGWRRAVGYHESVAGDLDRHLLERWSPGVPLRIQHRSGAMWVLNTTALGVLDLADELTDDASVPPGVERDPAGRATGRLFRLDDWLRDRLEHVLANGLGSVAPDLSAVARRLLTRGVLSCTDATPHGSPGDLERYAGWCTAIEPLRVTLMVAPEVEVADAVAGRVGWTKIVLGDDHLPDPDSVVDWIEGSHRYGRPVAVHAVTGAATALAIAAWRSAGAQDGDRIEHGAIINHGAVGELSALGVRVVTQPAFVHERGDTYLSDVDPEDQHDLWRCASLFGAGVPVAAGSDAPYGPIDPWWAMATAITRHTATGRTLGAAEAISAQEALALYLSASHDPGGPARRVQPGEPADLGVLDRPFATLARDPSAVEVRASIHGGVPSSTSAPVTGS